MKDRDQDGVSLRIVLGVGCVGFYEPRQNKIPDSEKTLALYVGSCAHIMHAYTHTCVHSRLG
jgi:hypothetical protein